MFDPALRLCGVSGANIDDVAEFSIAQESGSRERANEGNLVLCGYRLGGLGCWCADRANEGKNLILLDKFFYGLYGSVWLVAVIITFNSSLRPLIPPVLLASLKAARIPSCMPLPSAAAGPSRAAACPNRILSFETPFSAKALTLRANNIVTTLERIRWFRKLGDMVSSLTQWGSSEESGELA